MKPTSFAKQSVFRELLPPDGLVSRLVVSQRERSVEVVEETKSRHGRVIDLRFVSEATPGAPARKQSAPLVTMKGMAALPGASGEDLAIRLAQIPSRRGDGDRTVATVGGDVDLRLGNLGLVEIGRTTSSGRGSTGTAIATYALSSGILGITPDHLAIRLGDRVLVIDDEAGTVTPNAPIPLSGRVYRLGSAGLLMMFDAVMFTSTATHTDVDLRGGRLVGLA